MVVSLQDYFDLISFITDSLVAETDSQTDILRAAGVDLAQHDPNDLVLTLRMWVLAIGFCIVASGLNTLYTLRQPSLTVTAPAVLLLAYPLGMLWEKAIPCWDVLLGCWSFNLNPGPFSTKVCCRAESSSSLVGESFLNDLACRSTRVFTSCRT